MTMAIPNSAHGASRVAAAPGLGLAFESDSSPGAGQGLDFAKLMKSVPETGEKAAPAGKSGQKQEAKALAELESLSSEVPSDDAGLATTVAEVSEKDAKSAKDERKKFALDGLPDGAPIAVAVSALVPADSPAGDAAREKGALRSAQAATGSVSFVNGTGNGPTTADGGLSEGSTAATTRRSAANDATPTSTGEATELLSLAKDRPAASTVVQPSKSQPTSNKEPAAVQTPNPVHGEGLASAQGKPIRGLTIAADKAAPQSAVVERVASAQSSQSPVIPREQPQTELRPAIVPELPVPAKVASAQGGIEKASGVAAVAATVLPASEAKRADNSTKAVARGEAAPLRGGAHDPVSASTQTDNAVGTVVAPSPLAVSSPVVSSSGAPLNLGGALGQQIVDLGVSGQWIDDIARQVASMAANPGHGRFQIASPELGAVSVDITPGAFGSNVVMTVDNEAAQSALVKDRKRLVLDAQLASVRLGEVRIDRVAAPGDTQRSDMTGQQQGGANGQPGTQSGLAQGNGQQGGQQNRQETLAFGQQTGGNNPKVPFTKAVMNDAVPPQRTSDDRGGRADNARYA